MSVAERRNFKLALCLSSLLHTLPVVLMLLLGNHDNSGEFNNADSRPILPKPQDTIEVDLNYQKGTEEAKKPKVPHENDNCDQFYGGIGIMNEPSGSGVMSVEPGYPAALAGIQPGDRLLADLNSIRGPVGTEITFEYIRAADNTIHTTTLVRDKICVGEVKNK